jgi:phenol 2-monooxygenase (NADPH)
MQIKSTGFISGIGVQYASSTITNLTGQPIAPSLIIGKRIMPQVILRAADARPFNIHDLCLSDNRFKILLFVGDLKNPKHAQRASKLAVDIGAEEGFLNTFGRRSRQNNMEWDAISIFTICAGQKKSINYLDAPKLFRSHWSKYVSFYSFVFC